MICASVELQKAEIEQLTRIREKSKGKKGKAKSPKVKKESMPKPVDVQPKAADATGTAHKGVSTMISLDGSATTIDSSQQPKTQNVFIEEPPLPEKRKQYFIFILDAVNLTLQHQVSSYIDCSFGHRDK